jgi:hypothetical protein
MRTAIALALVLFATTAQAQTWDELQALPKEVTVRVHELGGKGWAFADGKLLLVKDNELTILRSGRPFVIPKASIARVEVRRRDSPLEGALLGALLGTVAYATYAGQGCDNPGGSCAAGIIASQAGLGALIDWSHRAKRTVYRAP